MGLTGLKLQAFIFTMGGFAFLLFGYDQGVMGGLSALPSFLNRFGNPTATLLGFMVASYDVGCLLGALTTFIIGDRLGRRKAILLGCTLLIIGATLQASAFTRAQYIVGRIVAGMGTGFNSVTVPVYCSECVQAKWRGKVVVIQVSLVIFGIIISNFTNYGFVYGCSASLCKSEAQWRVPIILQTVFCFLVYLMMPWCIESPRWLAARGRNAEVAQVLARLDLQPGSTPTSPHVVERASIIIATAQHEAEVEASWREVFTMGELQNFRRLAISGLAGFFHQCTGINSVVYYAANIFENIGLSGRISYLMACVGSILFTAGSFCAMSYVERIGRRRIMMMGAALCATCQACIAICVAISTKYPQHKVSAGWGATVFILLFQLSFGVGWNCMAWLYGSEVSSLRMRNKGAATQACVNWSTNFLTVMVAPVGFANLGFKYYLVWMTITYASIPVLYCLYHETSGRTLEQMDDFFRKYQRWYIGDVANEWVLDEHGISGLETKGGEGLADEKADAAGRLAQVEVAGPGNA